MINEYFILKDHNKILIALQNKAVQINNINPYCIKEYSDTLSEAKDSKQQAALNRVREFFLYDHFYKFLFINQYNFQSLNDSYVPDVYDELLTQAEIQGHINYVNRKL